MNPLTKAIAVMIVAIMALCPFAIQSDTDAVTMDGLMLYQINPYECEGVAVKNYGSTTVDMKDYIISDYPEYNQDKEGYLEFKSIKVKAGETLVLVSEKTEGNRFSNQDNVIVYDKNGTDGVTSVNKFELANGGDGVYLFKNGTAIDAVLYGTCKDTSELWDGRNAPKLEGTWTQRHSNYDTNTADDWFTYVYGQTQIEFDPELKYNATVTPFLFPDSGGIPIHDALMTAQESIIIEMYQLTGTNILNLVIKLMEERNLTVEILLEGDSLTGGNYDPILDQKEQFSKLLSMGADIRVIGVGDSTHRYDFDHAKFALIDNKTTIVTSENWTPTNTCGELDDYPYNSDDGNRGWGAIIESGPYTSFMRSIFDNDRSLEYGDVQKLEDEYPGLLTLDITSVDFTYKPATDTYSGTKYNATVTPVLSNDTAYEALLYYIGDADERIYAQQQSLGSGYNNLESSSPVSLMAQKAEKKVEAKLMLSTGVTNVDDIVLSINSKTLVETAVFKNPYLHNKGIISDDRVWVSSINWTTTSIHDNREVCAVIESKEIADFFAEAFIDDFEKYYTYDGFNMSFVGMKSKYSSGKEIVFEVACSPEDTYVYEFDLGDGTLKTSNLPKIVASPSDGSYTLKVKATNSDGRTQTISMQYTVGSSSTSTDTPSGDSSTTDGTLDDIITLVKDNIYAIAPIIVIIIGAIVALIRKL